MIEFIYFLILGTSLYCGFKIMYEHNDMESRLQILRRYHGGDGSVTREEVMKALADD